MSAAKKRMSITFSPEWDDKLQKLKKERFENASTSEVLRFLIQKGLQSANVGSQNQKPPEKIG